MPGLFVFKELRKERAKKLILTVKNGNLDCQENNQEDPNTVIPTGGI